jgi:AsmA protein
METITGSGTLSANTIKSQDIALNNVRTNVELNKGVIQLQPLTADLFGGKAAGSLTLDVRPATPSCAINAKLSGVNTNSLLSAVSSVKNTLYGTLTADANVSFALVSSNDLPRTLNGTLGFSVANGELKNVNILNEISKVGKFVGAAPGQKGSGTTLSKLSGTFNIKNGVATTNSLVAALPEGSLSADGSLNLADQGVNMHVNAVLASGTSKAVGGTGVGGYLSTALANNKGELVIPAIVTGTLAHPVFVPDVQAIAKMKLSHLLPSTGDPGKFASGILGSALGGKGGTTGSSIVNGILGGSKTQQNGQQQQQPKNGLGSLLDRL